jgi:dipeptidyl aminopeptidase/acylaminoacyl peptidase
VRMGARVLALRLVVALSVATGAPAAPVEGPARPLTSARTVTSSEMPGVQPITIDDLFKSARSDSAVWSADGRSVIYSSNQSGRMNLWSQATDGGAPRQLTRSEHPQSLEDSTTDGKWLIYASGAGGHEINDLYALPGAGGEPVNLTNTPEQNEDGAQISHDGKFVAFSVRGAKESSLNVAVMDWATRQTRRLTRELVDGVQWAVVCISRDGRYIFANRFDWSLTIGEVHRLDAVTGEDVRLTPEGVYASVGDVSADGRYVSISIEAGNGVSQAALLEVGKGKHTLISPSPWEQKAGRFSPDGRVLLVIGNVDGRQSVLAYGLATGTVRDLEFPAGQNSNSIHATRLPQFSRDGRLILFPHSSGAEPSDYWAYDVAKGKARRVTQLNRLDTSRLPKTQLVRYPSKDGTVISAYLWMPYNLKRDGSAPAILLPHGGPTGQTIDQFDRRATAFASRGYLVLAPNFRGSTGYGRAFLDANKMDLGGGDLDDVVAGARFLIETGYVDAKKIGITGGSYGGYLTYMALAKTPAVWAVGVAEFGIVNWRTMWEHGAPQNRRYQKDLVGDPAEQPEIYERSSPLTYLHQLRAPLLVLHGENDPIVPVIEARQVVEYLQKNGRVVDLLIYAEEGHGFAKRENQVDALTRNVNWFDKYLKRDSARKGAG